jgi:hypothetical protein
LHFCPLPSPNTANLHPEHQSISCLSIPSSFNMSI